MTKSISTQMVKKVNMLGLITFIHFQECNIYIKEYVSCALQYLIANNS